ncbi:hypothetical protein UB46_13160 [Burkholderiaceae bacterium 16]|nr:hypothetical protein UB46_13160 [Burkholderiaceae bacterium 16]
MKNIRLTAAALVALPGFAAAQSVTLYGVVDTGVEYINHIGAARDSVARMPGLTGTVPSRWACAAAKISARA